ncbi:cytochrome c oxidase accessory protein CcoG [Azoarcus sp. L1K30]|uniref:cytochrome c oxidase accessory protein CcoG n=1 Tax=Azoarcus sp. L1K30 TaxID=2820277 RepID=UPI001B835CA1|nr:cytochrome c oxidase accessory protein CcoG [Azoarcus sp. L1K30]MBR0566110.1 cytochrome c oxidase accessory protein CcoG [Azoarcus sp. L1K30]
MQPPLKQAHGARIEFYNKTGKIHPRTTSGRFNTLRWSMVWLTQIVFYGLCWLPWGDRQAVLFDIAERKFYLFGLVLWPQDAMLLAVMLIVAATGLFFATALAGRVFCGFACPQTVYTAVFRWVEAKVEGDHLARMRLDQSAPGMRKFALKATKHAIWLTIALWTSITFVGYFTPIRELLARMLPGELGPWEAFWVFFYAAFTYLLAGFAREMVCMHMCPYSRFQGVMGDPDTRNVSYDTRRGEPRGALSRRQAKGAAAQGDCIDCGLCVQVCPTGIDIRQGLQYACINCGLCIDACDEVMTRIKAPTGLIRFASERELAASAAPARPRPALLRPRVQVYLATLVAFSAAGVVMLAERTPLAVDVLRDRHALLRIDDDGRIENDYLLKVANMLEQPRRFRLQVAGPADVRLAGRDVFEASAGSITTLSVSVSGVADPSLRGSQPIHFTVEDLDTPTTRAVEKSSFLLPMGLPGAGS